GGERRAACPCPRPPQAIDPGDAARRHDGQQVMAPGCGPSGWPFVAQDCLPAAKPARPPERPVSTERRTTGTAPARTAAPLAAAAASAAAAAPAAAATATAAPAAATAATPPCKQNRAAASARVEKALAHVKSPGRDRADACTAYRQDFFELVRAREMTALCKAGPERDQDLGRIDLAVEDVNGAIAESCGG